MAMGRDPRLALYKVLFPPPPGVIWCLLVRTGSTGITGIVQLAGSRCSSSDLCFAWMTYCGLFLLLVLLVGVRFIDYTTSYSLLGFPESAEHAPGLYIGPGAVYV